MSAVANQKALRRLRRLRAEKRVQPAAPEQLGFTLLEVMVAVAILAFSLVSIFSGEIGAIRMASRARLMTTASLLARCKMGEIEEEIMRTGFPAVSSTGSDECCQGGEVEGFTCEWEISRVVLPDQMAQQGEDEDGGPLGGLLGGAAPAAAPAMPAGPVAPEAMLSGSMVAGGGDMISQMAMQMVFPMLKPSIEEQVRRATVTVRWEEGSSTQEFDVVQYLVAEQLNSAQMGAVLGQPGGAPPGGPVPPPGGPRPQGQKP